MELINGRALAEQIKDGIALEVLALGDHRPNLAIIIVGDRPDSQLYSRLKEREAKKCGLDSHLYQLAENVEEQELLDVIKFLNNDEQIDGILVQLPLPAHLNADTIIQSIDPSKDVDCFTETNLRHLTEINKPTRLLPPVYLAVLMCLASTDQIWDDRPTVIIAKPGIFGDKLAELLTALKAKVTLVTPNNPELSLITRRAEIIISAAGQANLLETDDIAEHATIIDIGINKLDDKTVTGDIPSEASQHADYITPVPGGIGPMTVAFALKNTLDCYHRRHKTV